MSISIFESSYYGAGFSNCVVNFRRDPPWKKIMFIKKKLIGLCL